MTPADRVAASICWLARWRGQAPVGAEAALGRAQERHPVPCRYCGVPLDELVKLIRAPRDAKAESAFEALDRKAQYARVREAQDPPWWEGAIKGG